MLLRKLQPFIFGAMKGKKNNQSFTSVSTSNSSIEKSFQEGNAKLSYEIIDMIC